MEELKIENKILEDNKDPKMQVEYEVYTKNERDEDVVGMTFYITDKENEEPLEPATKTINIEISDKSDKDHAEISPKVEGKPIILTNNSFTEGEKGNHKYTTYKEQTTILM